jgi:hypothetical protein
MDQLSDLRTVAKFVEEMAHTGLTRGAVHYALFHRQTNGLEKAGAVVQPRGSRRIFIDRRKFENWLRNRPDSAEPPEPRKPRPRTSRYR